MKCQICRFFDKNISNWKMAHLDNRELPQIYIYIYNMAC